MNYNIKSLILKEAKIEWYPKIDTDGNIIKMEPVINNKHIDGINIIKIEPVINNKHTGI